MTRYNTSTPGDPCTHCGAPTVREIDVNEVCTRCDTYVVDCNCPPLNRTDQP